MDRILSQKNWEELISKLRQSFPQLTDEDVKHNIGMEEKMLRMVEYKLSKTKEEMQEIIIGFGMYSH